jgi:hypothetical protein
MTRPQTSSMCSKPVRDEVAALPMASKASIHSACWVLQPMGLPPQYRQNADGEQSGELVALAQVGVRFAQAATCSQGLKASAAPKYWMSPMTLLIRAAMAHARATSKA